MMAPHWTESEDTAVRLGAALDNDRGGQRQRELAARLDRTALGMAYFQRRLKHFGLGWGHLLIVAI